MVLARSKLTVQGKTSVPAEVCKKLRVDPGAVLEWVEEGGKIVVRRTRKYGWDEVRKALFPEGAPQARSLKDLKKWRQL